mmetsp:Transcript_4114/g.4709  ORF Transcript_4114/g.4709 Transcript_4114/m.4709 type:complete len:121 (+) Transcript_4114:48-410(+)|eukprot:CAMPEP_0197855118 /NCGR_PEP_ID=MMETSP1438-20131217/26016_1 /TAXON_ID=1461541 /ORGANISM="Pterosperma sp., Strain CCMP1384" /LENGTH=120 /DNA_ID=CAMNT_0043470107 /DNA_START=22 /DNA_END=384 /DNA_ORIENTATION=-
MGKGGRGGARGHTWGGPPQPRQCPTGTLYGVKCSSCGQINNVRHMFGVTGKFECGKCGAQVQYGIRDHWEAYEWAGKKPEFGMQRDGSDDRLVDHPLGDTGVLGDVEGRNAAVAGCCVIA